MALMKEPYGLVYNTDGSVCTTVRPDQIPFPGVNSFAVETATTNYVDVYNYSTQIIRGNMAIEQITYRSQKALKVTVSGTNPYIKLGFNTTQTVAAGDIYTGSVYAESNEVKITNTMEEDCCIYFTTSFFGGFARGYHTWTMNNNRLITILKFPNDEGSYSNFKMCVFFFQPGVYYVYNPQLEKKPFASSFVVGSRPNGRLVISVEDLKFDIANDDWVISYWKYPVATHDNTQNGYDGCSLGKWTSDRSLGNIYWGKENNSNVFILRVALSDSTIQQVFSSSFDPNWYFRNWHYEVVKKSGKVLSYYVDGVKQCEVTIPADKEIQTPFDVGLGLGTTSGSVPTNALIAAPYYGYNSATWTDDYIREVYEAKRPFSVQSLLLSIY